ncbi:MAG: NADH:ubiquinone reductase (Na(+)-transporting) subunit F [Bacteroidales bacterium]
MILLVSNTTVILLSIAVFLFIILALVLILLYARKKLVPQGKVKLKVNDKTYKVDPGQTILSALSNQDIYLPSACGGQGTCGLCTCQLVEGGGDILPTEKGFFTRKEEMDNWRLGCQVKIRDDMTIKVPPEVMEIKKWECEVISNHNVATFIKEFVVKLPEGETLDFKPGGYIQLDVPKIEVDFARDIEVEDEFKEDWDEMGLWDLKMKNTEETFRAYSMANHPAEGNIIKLNVRIATPPWDRSKQKFKNVNPGLCSSYVFSRKPGDKVSISGPYGDFFIKDTDKEMIYIGGGAGMAPLRSHIFHLFHTLKTDRKVSYWYGARSMKEIFYEEDFREIERKFPNFSFHIALSEPKEEDEWDGPVGFIHKVVYDQYLSKLEEPEEIEYYLCGPPVMNDAVQDMLYNLGVPQEMIAFDDFGG